MSEGHRRQLSPLPTAQGTCHAVRARPALTQVAHTLSHSSVALFALLPGVSRHRAFWTTAAPTARFRLPRETVIAPAASPVPTTLYGSPRCAAHRATVTGPTHRSQAPRQASASTRPALVAPGNHLSRASDHAQPSRQSKQLLLQGPLVYGRPPLHASVSVNRDTITVHN